MLAVDTSVARIEFMTNVFKLATTIPDKDLEDPLEKKRSNLEIAKGFVTPFPSNAETWCMNRLQHLAYSHNTCMGGYGGGGLH